MLELLILILIVVIVASLLTKAFPNVAGIIWLIAAIAILWIAFF